jgi:hypothetical protein
MINAQSQGLQGMLSDRGQLLSDMAVLPPQQFTPDIWGPTGAYQTASDTAYLNAENSQELQKQVDPLGAKIRQNTEQSVADVTDPANLQKLSQQNFAQNVLPGMYGTGFSPQSTVYGSALFDKGTLAGVQLRQALAQMGQPYMQTPQTGLSPTVTASAPLQAQGQNAAQNNAWMQGIIGQAGGLQNSLESGFNSLYSNLGQDISANTQNQLTAQQANQSAGAQQQGAIWSGLGALGGGLLSGMRL